MDFTQYMFGWTWLIVVVNILLTIRFILAFIGAIVKLGK